jgi:hypothetical protein
VSARPYRRCKPWPGLALSALVVAFLTACNTTPKALGHLTEGWEATARALHERDYIFDRLKLSDATAYVNGFFPPVACEKLASLLAYNGGEQPASDCIKIPVDSQLAVKSIIHIKGDEYAVEAAMSSSDIYIGAADIMPEFAPGTIVEMAPYYEEGGASESEPGPHEIVNGAGEEATCLPEQGSRFEVLGVNTRFFGYELHIKVLSGTCKGATGYMNDEMVDAVASEPLSTSVTMFTPWSSGMLRDGFKVSRVAQGTCWTHSLVTDRPDAGAASKART